MPARLNTAHSEETRQKLSSVRKGFVPSQSDRVKISTTKADIPKTKEAKANMSKAKKGTSLSDKTKQAIGESIKDSYKLDRMGREARFLTLLASGQSVKQAAQIVGFDKNIAYGLANNEQFRLAITEATMSLRAMLYADMPDMLDLAKNTLMDTMRSPTARTEVKVKAASHVISLAIFLASADKNFQPPPPTAEDLELIEGEAVGE
jgi:hypothetical protein